MICKHGMSDPNVDENGRAEYGTAEPNKTDYVEGGGPMRGLELIM